MALPQGPDTKGKTMLNFLTQNLATLVVAALVFGTAAAVARKCWHDHKAGRHSCSCGGGCEGCPGHSCCHGSAQGQ